MRLDFNGLSVNMGNLSRLSDAKTRSISAENPTGEKGKGAMAEEGTGARAARDLGRGWKISPSVVIAAGQTYTLADIQGPGAIQHIWMTPTGVWRHIILRIYWDDQPHPSVECPIGDFFASGWGGPGDYRPVNSLPICVNPGSAFNCYWPMPFAKRCRMTVENLADQEITVFYQIDYALNQVSEDAAYFHTQFHRDNPLTYGEPYTILENVRGKGHYVGTYMAWGVNNNGWWGEGEIKFFLDGDDPFPSICGTGTEDYFCGSYNFENHATSQYEAYNTPYAGLPQIYRPDGRYQSQQRFGLYRWHVPDPIRFEHDLRVNIQALGWRGDMRYLPLQDDIASVAYWYQTLPSQPLAALPHRDVLEIC